MNWLALLKKLENGLAPTLQNQQKGISDAFVGFVGATPATFQNSGCEIPAFADELPSRTNDASNRDATFAARLALFTDRGLNLGDAHEVAHRLALRDSQLDDRRICLECLHLSGTAKARRCSQWGMLGMSGPQTPAEMVAIPQRCIGFTRRLKEESSPKK